MNKNLLSVLLVSSITLCGCTGPGQIFEPSTYGVRNSVWYGMSENERYAARQSYVLEQQRYAEQRRIQAMLDAREAELARVREQRYKLEQEERNRRFERERQENNRRSAQENQRRLLQEQDRINAENARRSREQHNYNTAQTNLQSQEQIDLEEAKRRSLISQREDEARRQQARAQEQRDIEEATRRSMETYNHEQAMRNSETNFSHTWEPNEGQLVRAGELVMALQRELGRQPSVSEMQNRLQSNMGISTSQSFKILDDLGLA